MRVTREILVQLPQRTSDFVTTSGSIYLGRLAEWVGLTASEFMGTKYLRIKRIKQLQSEGRLNGSLRWLTDVPVAVG